MTISVCIPCYRSAKTLPSVVSEIKKEFASRPEEYQIILVNDGSPDNTFEVIASLCAEDEKIVGVELSRNYGQVSAKLAALQYVTGDAVVFMDDDGQHPASGIFALYDKLCEGYDVVYAHFENKKTSLFKKITSDMHNSIAEKLDNKPKGVHRSSFSAWSKTVVEAMKKYNSPFVSIGSYLMRITTKYAEVPVEHRRRLEGKSGYTLKKLFKMWFNIIFSYSPLPLTFASRLGGLFTAGGLVWLIVSFFVGGQLLTKLAIAFLFIIGGMIMTLLGLMGEYISRIYSTVSGLPQSYVRQVINGGK